MTAVRRTDRQTPADEGAVLPGVDIGRVSRRRRWIVVAVAVVIIAAAAWVGVTDPFKSTDSPASGLADNAYPTSTATVNQQPLSSQTQVDATLGYAGTYEAVNQAQGTITALPAIGQVVAEGHALYQVDGQPVVLLYGMTPAYRALSEAASATDVTGSDVTELNADLVAMGYVSGAELSPTSDDFGFWTKVGVERLQAALGVTANGTLALGQAVFLPSAARVTAVTATLGAAVPPGGAVLSATSTTPVVTIELDSSQQSEVAVGDAVTITLPNNRTTPGVISSVGTVATAPSGGGNGGGGGNPTITVLVAPSDPAAIGNLDQSPVEVAITTASAPSALVVPVNALLALASGGYAVEVVDPDGVHHLEAVTPGLFDDANGLVQVTGTGVAVGQRVVVPSS